MEIKIACELTVKIKSILKEVKSFDEFLNSFLKTCHVTEEVVYAIYLSVHEAIINVVEHTYNFVENDIEITMRIKEGVFECDIRDFGNPVSPEKIHSRELENLDDKGLGVYLMQSLMDDVKYVPGAGRGNDIIMKKKL